MHIFILLKRVFAQTPVASNFKMTLQIRKNIGRRIGATLIDYGLTITISVIYIVQFGEYNSIDNSYSVHGYKSLPLIIYWLIYHVLTENLTGTTLGHRIFKLIITDLDGEKTRLIQNLKRHLIDPIDFVIFGIPAMISINNTEKHQRLGDIWAKTIVIDKDFKRFKNFYSRPEDEQEWLIQNTWCDRCQKADTGLENPTEFEQNGKLYISGFCNSCGRELISEIETKNNIIDN
jgi:uncharacterized RDD family membrane protein YckC